MSFTISKKILFVSTQFPPNDSIGTQRIVKFIKYLKRKGWEIHVLTLEEKYYRDSNNSYQSFLPDDIRVYRKKKIEIFQFWKAIKKFVYWKPKQAKNYNHPTIEAKRINDPKKFSFLFEIKELISNLLQYPDQENGFFFSILFFAYRLIKKHGIPFLFISSPPHSPLIPVTLLKKFKSFIYIVDFRDPWARSQWEQKSRHLYQRIERKLDLLLEEKTLRAADVAIFNTEKLRAEFAEFYAKTSLPPKFHFIPNGFDPELKAQLSGDGLRGRKKNNRITLLHTGTLYKKRNPLVIFEGFLKFRESNPEKAKEIELSFIGTLSEDLQYLRKYIKDNCLTENVKFNPKLSYHEILEEMKTADWMVLLQPGTTFQIPAKFYDYLLVDKPIWGVLEENSVGEAAIKKLNIGYVSHCQSPDSIVEFFKMITNGKILDFTPDGYELQKYSLPFLVDQLEKIILNQGITSDPTTSE